MQRRHFLLAGGAATVLARRAAASPATSSIHAHTGALPPFVLDAGPRRGALYEVVEELLRRVDIPAQIDVLPWKRAQFLTQHQARSVIFPLSRVQGREADFRWLAPLYRERYVFLG